MYVILNKTEDFSHSFKSLGEVAEWMKRFSVASDLDAGESLVIQEDFTPIFTLKRFKRDRYAFRSEKFVCHFVEEEFGPGYEVVLSSSGSAERLGTMTWPAVLAVVGIIGGKYE